MADTVDHVISKAVLRKLASLSDVEITKKVISSRVLKVWSCRECNSLASSSMQNSLRERKAYIKEKLSKRYKKILSLPNWEKQELDEIGYTLRRYIECVAKVKSHIQERMHW